MITCEFIQISENLAQCSKCGNTIHILDGIDDVPFFPCGSIFNELFKNDTVDAQAVKKQASESPVEANNDQDQCSEEEIEARFSICKSCEKFSQNTCTECGCILSRDRVFLNKLAWKDQSCPLNKW